MRWAVRSSQENMARVYPGAVAGWVVRGEAMEVATVFEKLGIALGLGLLVAGGWVAVFWS